MVSLEPGPWEASAVPLAPRTPTSTKLGDNEQSLRHCESAIPLTSWGIATLREAFLPFLLADMGVQ